MDVLGPLCGLDSDPLETLTERQANVVLGEGVGTGSERVDGENVDTVRVRIDEGIYVCLGERVCQSAEELEGGEVGISFALYCQFGRRGEVGELTVMIAPGPRRLS